MGAIQVGQAGDKDRRRGDGDHGRRRPGHGRPHGHGGSASAGFQSQPNAGDDAWSGGQRRKGAGQPGGSWWAGRVDDPKAGAGGAAARQAGRAAHTATSRMIATPPTASTGWSTAMPGSSSARRPTPIGVRGDSATAVATAMAAPPPATTTARISATATS
jgi:hypothetical protein